MNVEIKYGDVAIGAKESFLPSSENASFVSHLDNLKADGLSYLNYGNPCEDYSVLLDGKTLAFPLKYENKNTGFVSDKACSDYDFNDDVSIHFEANELFSSSGITLVFDTDKNIFPSLIELFWERNGKIIDSQLFSPDSAYYFCNKNVEYYNGLTIYFYAMNMPNSRVNLRAIDFGYRVQFGGKKLKNVEISNNISLVSSEIPIGTCDFVVSSTDNINYSFQQRQPIEIWIDNVKKFTFFAKNSFRTSEKNWTINAENYIGVLDRTNYAGGMYGDVLEYTTAYDLIEDIFITANVPVEIDESLNQTRIYGYLPYTTCREALKQVLFAVQYIADSNCSDKVKIRKIENSSPKIIQNSRIGLGLKEDKKSNVTSVQIASHKYYETDEQIEIYKSDVAENANVYIKFAEPLHSLSIVNGTILEYGVNYAILNTSDNCVLYGKKYKHEIQIKEKRNPLVLRTDAENTVKIEKATLITKNNVDKVLDACYNYYVNRKLVQAKIIEGKHDNGSNDESIELLDSVIIDGDYLGEITGKITSQRFNLNGNNIVKDSVIE